MRLALDIFPTLRRVSGVSLVDFAVGLESLGQAHGFEFIALGPAGVDVMPQLPKIFAATQSIFATAHIVDPAGGAIDGAAIHAAARVIQASSKIENGFGNLRFAALANVPAGTPFFPAAYYGNGQPSFAIATESADLAVVACRKAKTAEEAHRLLEQAITEQGQRITTVAEKLAQAHTMPFGGIDFSLAPFPDPAISIGAALESLSGQPLGAAGTLTAAATLTSIRRSEKQR